MANRLPTALSLTALVVAILGWTPIGEAARGAVFPPGSVGTAQLRANAVTSPKIRNGSVGALDLQKRSITAAHVRPGSLLGSSFRAGELPAGPKGDKGDKGDKGEKGEPGVSAARTARTSGPTQALTSTQTAVLTLALPAGKHVLLGKVVVSGKEPNFTAICTTGVGTTGDTASAAAYTGPSGSNQSQTLAMHTVVDLAAPGTAAIRCWTPRSGNWGSPTLTAIQVGG